MPRGAGERVLSMTVLDLTGRRLLATSVQGPAVFPLPPAARHAVLVVRIVEGNGTVHTTRLVPDFSSSHF